MMGREGCLICVAVILIFGHLQMSEKEMKKCLGDREKRDIQAVLCHALREERI